MMFGFYIRNNIGVAFQCFAGGLFAGLGSLFFLAYNGAFGGAVAGYLTERGLSSTFYSFVATHAAFELTAIVLSGAAGLKIGHALLAPGRRTRVQSLVIATRGIRRHPLRRHRHADRRRGRRSVLVVGALAESGGQVRRRRRLLDRRARLSRAAGPPCRLTRSRCGCGRGRRWRRPISARGCARAPRRSVYACLRHRRRCPSPRWRSRRSRSRAGCRARAVVGKPWLDRTILFVLSRAAFGQPTTPGDLWRAQRQVWWSQLLFTWTVRRLSPWRSLTQPVYQLEGWLVRNGGRARPPDPAHEGRIAPADDVGASAWRKLALTLRAALARSSGSRRRGQAPDVLEVLTGDVRRSFSMVAIAVAYAIVVVFLEPFYVAAGFAMYLNRRAELEAWDIEQEFRRAFAH